MINKTFLIEIGTEELPAKQLYNIAYSFYKNFIDELKINDISYKKISWFATPRRLALQIVNINILKKNIEIYKKGPSKKDAFDKHGSPTQIAEKWAKYCGINIHQATVIKNKKGEWLTYKTKQKKESIDLILPKISILSLKRIGLKNTMKWHHQNDKFFRPIRNIVMLLNKNIIPGKIYGVNSSNILYNHICQKETKILLKHASQYQSVLLKKFQIIANYESRKAKIKKDIKDIVKKINGQINIKTSLLNEVNSLVESPVVILAKFNINFLKIPEKILIYTIEHHQKCFTIYDSNKKLLPYFLFVINIHTEEQKKIIIGYEKVIHARLSDTEFFLKKDREKKLESSLLNLKNIIFQEHIGTIYDKTMRVKLLAKWISYYTKSNTKNAIRAAILSKCDLISNMVCEFPELQGIIGMYHALSDKENKNVAMSIQEQYLPSFSKDKLPSTMLGCTLSIADKIDTLSGIFLTGQIPTSDKDPFALRRLAISILRILINKKIPLDLKYLINKSLITYKSHPKKNVIYNKIIAFFLTRLLHWYEEKKYDIKTIKSVLSYNITQPFNIDQRIQAIHNFKNSKNFTNVILFIKRLSKILQKNKKNLSNKINIHLMIAHEEKELFDKTVNFVNTTNILFQENKYQEIFFKICQLEKPINNFFNNIQVYHANDNIQNNRLKLLNIIHNTIFKITNFNFLY